MNENTLKVPSITVSRRTIRKKLKEGIEFGGYGISKSVNGEVLTITTDLLVEYLESRGITVK